MDAMFKIEANCVLAVLYILVQTVYILMLADYFSGFDTRHRKQ